MGGGLRSGIRGTCWPALVGVHWDVLRSGDKLSSDRDCATETKGQRRAIGQAEARDWERQPRMGRS